MTDTVVRAKFIRELGAVQDDMVRLGSMVDNALQHSIDALQYRDADIAHSVIAGDGQINDLRFQIEEDCTKLIAMQQPLATDLRIIVSIINILVDLERMGDNAAGIAQIALQVGDEPPLKPLVDLPKMAIICREMLRQSLAAFVARDNEAAKRIVERDDEVDDLYQKIFREMLSFMTDDPETVTRAMYFLFVGHNLERVADRVTNICERVMFITTGQMEEIHVRSSNISAQ